MKPAYEMRISDWSSDVCSSDLPATAYPANPNGSADAISGLSSDDGRATILMPHPERTPRKANLSWAPDDWPDDSPWLRMFRNARVAVRCDSPFISGCIRIPPSRSTAERRFGKYGFRTFRLMCT